MPIFFDVQIMSISKLDIPGKKRVAVVGSGISGLSAAWLLRNKAEVDLYETEQRFGGHTHTFTVAEEGSEVAVDTGFMVFNRPNYPLLSRLFSELKIETYATDMSFSVSLDQGRLEYAGTSLNTLFAQRKNLINRSFHRMLLDIMRFNRLAKSLIDQGTHDSQQSLADFLDDHNLGQRFRQDYLYPMAAAIWSCPKSTIADFPVQSFIRFFYNHGLIRLIDRPQWYTVTGGASSYVNKMLGDMSGRVLSGATVTAVTRNDLGVKLTTSSGQVEEYDEVILACHADQSLDLLKDASAIEKTALECISFQPNRVVLHRDKVLMPQNRKVWASWNYSDAMHRTGNDAVSVTYWMNSLQRLNTSNDYFVSLNPCVEPDSRQVVAEFTYHHPVFDEASMQLPALLQQAQGKQHVWFCGAWTGYGFHEDGLRSAVEVATQLGAELPWQTQLQASRLLTSAAFPVLQEARA